MDSAPWPKETASAELWGGLDTAPGWSNIQSGPPLPVTMQARSSL